jgi:histidyl-tRNA synthetase
MKLRSVKGMNDILPVEARRFQRLENIFRQTVEAYGFEELRTPLVEELGLFQKSTGETSEVVQKQMFLLARERESLALRPEGTPSAARVYIGESQHAKEPITKWYYLGPMFRAEQPQRGRYRQFHQAGCELYGDAGPIADAEMISMLVLLAERLGLKGVQMSINTLGGAEARALYRQELVRFFEPKRSSLSEHACARLGDNPLRILDSKDPRDQEAAEGAPVLLDCLTPEDREHWRGLLHSLDALGVPYVVDPRLVRGLDYYTRTCFELTATSGEIGSQNAILGGGRYDDLLAGLGGQKTPAIGFAMGLERVLLALPDEIPERPPLVFLAPMGDAATQRCLLLAEALRRAGHRTELDGRGGSLKSMLRRANGMAARVCLVLGDTELSSGRIQCKDLARHEQLDLGLDEVLGRLSELLASDAGPTGRSAATEGRAE